MTATFNLSLPLDIPWQRICVTRDMMDRQVCDTRLPPKWQSSMAVFKYVPADEYQLYPDYTITYLKVTATVTGYQPIEDEIQGEIDWSGVNVETIEGLTELLSSYNPCHGAIVQVVVGPHRGQAVDVESYPFFLDFEPKKRELFEMATDTKERQSRSIETLNVTKSAGTASSQEVMDVDMGGSTSFGIQGSYAGTGGGFNFGTSSAGQWGTKNLNTQESMTTRSSDFGQERRETHSHTTQISQMYHLLDSYHLGTNRAVFFVQPRPHVIEAPSGFVRGPRPVEGIQEFFLVVAAPKARPDFCVSVRLDTSHLMETDILEYDYRTDVSELANAVAPVPTRSDIPDGTTTREACFITCWDVTYLCYRTHAVDDKVYTAPSGYVITGYDTIVNDRHHGSTAATIAPGNRTLTVHAEANGHICFEDSGLCLDCPDEVDKWSGYARRQVQVRLRSEERIKKVGTRQSLLITTRGLCCCPGIGDDDIGRVRVKVGPDIPDYLGGSHRWTPTRGAGATAGTAVSAAPPGLELAAGETISATAWHSARAELAADPTIAPGGVVAVGGAGAVGPWGAMAAGESVDVDCACGGRAQPALQPRPMLQAQVAQAQVAQAQVAQAQAIQQAMQQAQVPERQLSIRQANAMIEFIERAMIRSFRDPHPERQARVFEETDLFSRQLGRTLRRTARGRQTMARPLVTMQDGWAYKLARAIAERIGKPPEAVTVGDLIAISNYQLEVATGIPVSGIARVKIAALGVPMRQREPGLGGPDGEPWRGPIP